jgi:hypothetical protein
MLVREHGKRGAYLPFGMALDDDEAVVRARRSVRGYRRYRVRVPHTDRRDQVR